MEKEESIYFDVLIVGGGPAGLSCALSLARGGRSLILCDDNRPRNKNATEIRNLPGHEGISPSAYREMLKKSLCSYDQVMVRDISVTSIMKEGELFISTLANQKKIRSKRVVLAEGLEDILPEIPGLGELWGRSVFHCPYCHGYERAGKELGVLATNVKSIQLIRLLKGLTDEISVFFNDRLLFLEEELEELRNENLKIFSGKIEALVKGGEKLTGVLLENNELVKCNTLFIQNKFRPKSRLGVELGCTLTESGIYKVDEDGQSDVEGVYFAGDVGSHNHSVIMATALGSHVGICVNADILRHYSVIQMTF